jgi:hypothetical protein
VQEEGENAEQETAPGHGAQLTWSIAPMWRAVCTRVLSGCGKATKVRGQRFSNSATARAEQQRVEQRIAIGVRGAGGSRWRPGRRGACQWSSADILKSSAENGARSEVVMNVSLMRRSAELRHLALLVGDDCFAGELRPSLARLEREGA